MIATIAVTLNRRASAGDTEFFEAKIRPLLVDRCYACHSASARKLKGELYLDTKQGVLNGGKDGPILVPGDPEHTKLIEAVRWTNKDLQMPPKERLKAEQVADLEKWVKAGAPDPRTGPAASTAAGIDFAAARKQWPYHPPVEPAIPAVKGAPWCKSPIDHFILAKLEEKGLRPAPPAPKRVLIRRAYFDLIGLPPKPQQVDAFLADESPDAFPKVVDGLLASPQYGQRWARHWLDVVRYTDSFDARGVGNAGDCANAWRYRDWVVKSFNEDLPYDQFITQQVAGDLIPERNGKFNADGIIATEMYVIGNWPGGDADRKKMLTDIVDDQIDVTGRAFEGLTFACARCHDHKFDPIPTADYYGLAGIFFSSHFMPGQGSPTSGGPLLRFPLASPAEVEQRKKQTDQIAALQSRIDQFRAEKLVEKSRELLPDSDRYLVAAAEYHRLPAGPSRPKVDAFAAQRKLNGVLLSRWVDFATPYLAHDQTRTLLATARPNIRGIAGVDAWTGPIDQPPNMIANNTDHSVPLGTLTLPPKSVCVHPGQKSGVAVGWRSPISGTVSIRGGVIDADPVCGNGIDWAIDHVSGKTTRRLAGGAFPNGGKQEFSAGDGASSLATISVKAGEFLQIDVYPKGDYSCDTTVVDLEIAETDGAKRTWNLAHDILPNVLMDGKGNPHPDSLGNAGVWQFYEIPDQSPGGAFPGDSVLTKWAEAADAADGARVSETARAVRDALVAANVQADDLRKHGKNLAELAGADGRLYREVVTGKGPFATALKSGDELLSPEARHELQGMQESLAQMKKTAPPPLGESEGMTEGGVPDGIYAGIHDAHIHVRGRYDRQTDLVPRHFPRILAGDNQPPITQGSGRLQLAQFLASPKNPLTARVMVNRLWQHHFDDGIVRTPNNYGKLGIPPTHPELLDWLAIEFVKKGWSIKTMQREIMLSAAYQQSSIADAQTLKSDPDDLLFGWVKRRRLEAEAIRDSLLFQAGTLDTALDGPSIRDLNTHRRTLYLMTIRSERSDYRTLFDAADSTAIVDQRIDSTVAPQALFLLNNPFVLEQAKLIAARVLKEAPADDRAKINWLYNRLYSRPASEKEMDVGEQLLKESQQPQDGAAPLSREAAWEAYCQVLVCANEFVYVD
jgi:hypothetical protein